MDVEETLIGEVDVSDKESLLSSCTCLCLFLCDWCKLLLDARDS